MFVRMWRFRPKPGAEAAFERTYGSHGAWAVLFSRGVGYRGTELLREAGDGGEYLTVDRWDSAGAFRTFLAGTQADYDALDRECASLTISESPAGEFTVIG